MEEQIIKLSKEKGFIPENIMTIGTQIAILKLNSYDELSYYFLLFEIQKWLREIHKINVESNYLPNIAKYGCLYIPMSSKAKITDIQYVNKLRFNTYEEALEIGLLEALKLIQ